jgi:hypothetical protein
MHANILKLQATNDEKPSHQTGLSDLVFGDDEGEFRARTADL